MTDDFYARLGVDRDASDGVIKQSFRRKAREMHPDVGGNAEAFARLREAFDCLSDPLRRAQYDQFGVEGEAEARKTREKMAALFSFALDQALLKLRQNTQGVSSAELVALMIERLTARRADFASEKSQLVKALAATEDILGRADAQNEWLREAVGKRKTFCEERIGVVAAELDAIDLCVRELSGSAAGADPRGRNFGDWVDVYATVG